MKLTIERKIQASFGFGLLVLVLLGAVAWSLAKRSLETAVLVDRANAVLVDKREILVSVLNLETSVRGFVITDAESFLEPYHQAMEALPPALRNLREHGRSQPDWSRRVERITDLVRVRVERAEGMVRLCREGQGDLVRNQIKAGGGQQITAEIRAELLQLEREARGQLNTHLANMHRQTRLTMTTVTSGLLVALVMLVVAGMRVTHDLTQRRLAEMALADSNRRLEEQAVRLRDANRELEAFSYSVSHDLRAPLRGIDGFSRMLAEDYGPQLDEEGLRLVGVIRGEARRMGLLIDDLLNFSRVGRQQLQLAQVDMTALAGEAWAELLRHHEGNAPELVLHPMPPVRGDRPLLRQVFINLIGNALKFSFDQEKPRIEIGGANHGGVRHYFVRDNGVGFDPQHAHKLFGVFQRLHSEAEFEGVGVGLALVQRILHRHGATIRAEGRPNEGAVFHFEFPEKKES